MVCALKSRNQKLANPIHKAQKNPRRGVCLHKISIPEARTVLHGGVLKSQPEADSGGLRIGPQEGAVLVGHYLAAHQRVLRQRAQEGGSGTTILVSQGGSAALSPNIPREFSCTGALRWKVASEASP